MNVHVNLSVNDKAWEAAQDAALQQWQTGSADTTQMLLAVRAALLAAAPILIEPLLGELRADRDEHVHSSVTRWLNDREGEATAAQIEQREALARGNWYDGHGYSAPMLRSDERGWPIHSGPAS